MTTCRLWGEDDPREVVAEFSVTHPCAETMTQEAQRKAKHLPAQTVSYTVVVVKEQ